MARYGVTLPMAGTVYVEVEAENEDDAIDAALNSELTSENIEDWDVYDSIVKGNVYYCPLNNPEVEELD